MISGAIINVSVSSGIPSSPIKPNASMAGSMLGIIASRPPLREPSDRARMIEMITIAKLSDLN